MSNKIVCPECKTRPVSAGNYLCSRCERALGAARDSARTRGYESLTEDSGEKKLSVFSFFQIGKRRQEEEDGPIDLPPAERPRWYQYTVLTCLTTIGLMWALAAHDYYAGGRSHQATQASSEIQDAGRGLSLTWGKLDDVLAK